MTRRQSLGCCLGVFLIATFPIGRLYLPPFAFAQTIAPSPAAQEPKHVTVCQLAQNPSAFDRTLVKLSGTATQGFENFTLADPSCRPPISDEFSIWLTYGGTMPSGTIYCCPGEGEKKQRKQPIEVEGVTVSLVNDVTLRRFVDLLKQKPHTARAILIGVFFAGEQRTSNCQPTFPGYGHLGCCSLLVIRQVESVEP